MLCVTHKLGRGGGEEGGGGYHQREIPLSHTQWEILRRKQANRWQLFPLTANALVQKLVSKAFCPLSILRWVVGSPWCSFLFRLIERFTNN